MSKLMVHEGDATALMYARRARGEQVRLPFDFTYYYLLLYKPPFCLGFVHIDLCNNLSKSLVHGWNCLH